jgi:hypothetical protein
VEPALNSSRDVRRFARRSHYRWSHKDPTAAAVIVTVMKGGRRMTGSGCSKNACRVKGLRSRREDMAGPSREVALLAARRAARLAALARSALP